MPRVLHTKLCRIKHPMFQMSLKVFFPVETCQVSEDQIDDGLSTSTVSDTSVELSEQTLEELCNTFRDTKARQIKL